MSLSLLSQNVCNFDNCSLHFATTYDLIAHIEYVHIPLIMDEQKKASAINQPGDLPSTVQQNMPLSCFQRVFPQSYRPSPTPIQQVKVSFNHYRKKHPVPQLNPLNMIPPTSTFNLVQPKREEEHPIDDDMEECGPTDPETRFRCNWLDCGKRFKNSNALTLHFRTTHNQKRNDETISAHQTALASALEGPSVASPTKYAASRPHKCNQCSKRYKTIQGLQNHLSQAHSKLNEPPGTPSADTNAQSPAAIAQMILQKAGQNQQNAERQNYNNQRPLPVSLAPTNQNQMAQDSRAGLPVRSFQIELTQQARGIQGPAYAPQQPIGQMLKQQMNRQQQSHPTHQQMPPQVHYQPHQQHQQMHPRQMQMQGPGMEAHHPPPMHHQQMLQQAHHPPPHQMHHPQQHQQMQHHQQVPHHHQAPEMEMRPRYVNQQQMPTLQPAVQPHNNGEMKQHVNDHQM